MSLALATADLARAFRERDLAPAAPALRMAADLLLGRARAEDLDRSAVSTLLLGLGLPLGPHALEPIADPHAIGETYAASLPPTTRAKAGAYYTPAELADRLWDALCDGGATPEMSFHDLAAGAGSLLLRPLRSAVQSALSSDTSPEISLRRIAHRFTGVSGTDLDPVACRLANALLAAEMLPLWARIERHRRPPMPHLLMTGDGLSYRGGNAVDVVVLNPPYGRVRLTPAERAAFADRVTGHANLYGLFLAAAIERVRDGGLVGAVLPTSFLGGAYGRALRSFIAAHAEPLEITLVDERHDTFAGVLQQTCLLVLRKNASRHRRPRVRSVADGERLVDLGAWELPGAPDAPWLLPRREADMPLLERALHHPGRLGDLCRISTGPLVWNRRRADLTPRATDDSSPVIWAADISVDGEVRPHPSRASRRHLRGPAPMALSHPAVLLQRTTAPEQPRRLVAGLLDQRTLNAWGGRVVIENHVNVITPRDGVSLEDLYALLRSDEADRLYRCITGSVAVSAYELAALPIGPPPDRADTRS